MTVELFGFFWPADHAPYVCGRDLQQRRVLLMELLPQAIGQLWDVFPLPRLERDGGHGFPHRIQDYTFRLLINRLCQPWRWQCDGGICVDFLFLSRDRSLGCAFLGRDWAWMFRGGITVICVAHDDGVASVTPGRQDGEIIVPRDSSFLVQRVINECAPGQGISLTHTHLPAMCDAMISIDCDESGWYHCELCCVSFRNRLFFICHYQTPLHAISARATATAVAQHIVDNPRTWKSVPFATPAIVLAQSHVSSAPIGQPVAESTRHLFPTFQLPSPVVLPVSLKQEYSPPPPLSPASSLFRTPCSASSTLSDPNSTVTDIEQEDIDPVGAQKWRQSSLGAWQMDVKLPSSPTQFVDALLLE